MTTGFCDVSQPPANNPWLAPPATQECPNYEWLVEGYDGSMGNFTTPNLPGHSCTFRSASSSGHLAWAVPSYQATYFVPGMFFHLFLMYAPIFTRVERNLDYVIGIVGACGDTLDPRKSVGNISLIF